MVMFMRPRQPNAREIGGVGPLTGSVIAVSVALILIFGVWPSGVLRQVRDAGPAAHQGPAVPTTTPIAQRR
jgi:hypothetical protein